MEDENHQRTFSHLHKNRNRHTHDSFGIVLWYGSCTETELLRYSDLVGFTQRAIRTHQQSIYLHLLLSNKFYISHLSLPPISCSLESAQSESKQQVETIWDQQRQQAEQENTN